MPREDPPKAAWGSNEPPGPVSEGSGSQGNMADKGHDADAAGVAEQKWPAKFGQQFVALFRKNMLISWRNRRATLLQVVFSPFFFMILLVLIDIAIQADLEDSTFFSDVRDPEAKLVGGIPPCEDDIYAKSDCIDFGWIHSGGSMDDPDALEVVRLLRETNPGRVIPESKTKGFANEAESSRWHLDNPERSNGVIDFSFEGAGRTKLVYNIQTNSTVKFFKGDFQHPHNFAQLPMQTAMERVGMHFLRARDDAGYTEMAYEVRVKEYPHPPLVTSSIISGVAGPFLFAAAMFGFVMQISSVVAERENGLRRALRGMGMLDSAYWLSIFAWETILVFCGSLVLVVCGCMFQFDLFLNNSFFLMFFFFFLFELALMGFAMFLSTFIQKVITATNIGFMVFIIGWIFQIVILFGFPFIPKYEKSGGGFWGFLFAVQPWTILMKGLQDAGRATSQSSSPGISWGQRYSYCRDTQNEANRVFEEGKYIDHVCVLSMGSIMEAFLGLYLGYILLAVYLDNVLPNEYGMRRPPWYFLTPSYWKSSFGFEMREPDLDFEAKTKLTLDEDVAAEEERVKAMRDAHAQKRSGDQSETGASVEVFGLSKTFKPLKGKAFTACKGSWFSIARGELFCLLGPNGAGKTTTINCLTGALEPTAGDAVVNGHTLRSSGGMDNIRSQMGVCPQFDVLWDQLSGREHLMIYGEVKGIPKHMVASEADRLLEETKLTPAALLRTSGYSGGMKRRLSVAIALLGNPKVVYLDEPTTGMDPISRRHVWDIVEAAKKGRAIVLTTHSMEEADILGDRMAIMCRGQIRCLGSGIRLKSRFGAGYKLSVSLTTSENPGQSGAEPDDSNKAQINQNAAQIRQLVQDRLGVSEAEENRAYINFLVPRDKEPELPQFLGELEALIKKLGLSDLQLSLATLEEVFLSIAAQAETEFASTGPVKPERIALEDGSFLDVPMGARYVQHPVSQQYYVLKWAQDEYGALQVADHELYVPPAAPVQPQGIGSQGQPQVPAGSA